jgi:hypothetical protein
MSILQHSVPHLSDDGTYSLLSSSNCSDGRDVAGVAAEFLPRPPDAPAKLVDKATGNVAPSFQQPRSNLSTTVASPVQLAGAPSVLPLKIYPCKFPPYQLAHAPSAFHTQIPWDRMTTAFQLQKQTSRPNTKSTRAQAVFRWSCSTLPPVSIQRARRGGGTTVDDLQDLEITAAAHPFQLSVYFCLPATSRPNYALDRLEMLFCHGPHRLRFSTGYAPSTELFTS